MEHTVTGSIELSGLVKDDLEAICGAGSRCEPDLPGIEDGHLADIYDCLLNADRVAPRIPAHAVLGLLRNLKRYEMCRNRYRASRGFMRVHRREMTSSMAGEEKDLDAWSVAKSQLEREKAYNHTIVAECRTLLGLVAPVIRRILPAIDEDVKSIDRRYRRFSYDDYFDCVIERSRDGTGTGNGSFAAPCCSDTCCFCLESLDTCGVVHELIGCGHQFHPRCLSRFLTSKRVIPQCPLCRTEISPDVARKVRAERREALVEKATERLRSRGWSDEGTLQRAAETVVAELLDEKWISDDQITHDPFADARFAPEPAPADVGARNDAAVIAYQAADAANRAVYSATAAVRMAVRGPIRRFRLRRPVPDDDGDSDADGFYDWDETDDPVVTSCEVRMSTAWPSAP